MKKIGIIICLIFICQIYGAAALQTNNSNDKYFSKFDEYLDQKQTILECVIYDTFLAQSFRPTLNNIERVELALYIQEKINQVNITLSIRNRLYGRDIGSTTISSDIIPYNSTHNCYWDWIAFDFQSIELIPDKKYYLILSLSEGKHNPFEENVMWFIGWKNPYIKGSSYASKINLWAPIWILLKNNGDFSFKTYGIK